MLYDAHCHPAESPETLGYIGKLDATMCVMTTNLKDLDLVRSTARDNSNVVPAFGLHPWYTHMVSFGGTKAEHYSRIFRQELKQEDLDKFPEPVPVEDHMARIRAALIEFPGALVGEIGLDKAFKVNISGTPGGPISNFKTSMEHQSRVFRLQLELAAELERATSVHGVQCHLQLLEECTVVVKQHSKSKLRICLHSFSGTPEFASQRWTKLPVPVYFSLSILINSKNTEKTVQLVKAVPRNRVLSESDYPRADDKLVELLQGSTEMLESGGVDKQQIEQNFWEFVGDAARP